MKKIEKFFDISMVLMTIYSALENVREEEEIELVFDLDATIPKELRGDVESVTHMLSQLLVFIFQNTHNREVVLKLRAPKDFLYEESITFSVEDTGINAQKARSFFEARLKPVLERLDGKAFYDEETQTIAVSIPFKLNDLGNRRYYRLPDISMLGKKVLLICKSRVVAESLKKMFSYFLYEVDVGADEYKKHGSNLAHYDIFVLDKSLLTEGITSLVQKVQEKYPLKFVILQDANDVELLTAPYVSAYLVKPVMQESVFELIIALFEEDVKERKIRQKAGKPFINMERYIMDAFKKSEEAYMEMEKIKEQMAPVQNHHVLKDEEKKVDEDDLLVLNVTAGMENTKKLGLNYSDELKGFWEKFNKSDIYLRDIAKSRAVWQIKEFAIDLEKRSSVIGAERVANLAEKISLMFVYDNLEMLDVYSRKYHVELEKLMREIKNYLKHH